MTTSKDRNRIRRSQTLIANTAAGKCLLDAMAGNGIAHQPASKLLTANGKCRQPDLAALRLPAANVTRTITCQAGYVDDGAGWC
jgi:hypothetical protein